MRSRDRVAYARMALWLLFTLDAQAGAVDPVHSSIAATFAQMNVPIEQPFRRFSGTLDFDPTQPAATRAEVNVLTASFDLGNEEYNAELRKPGWFDSARYPRAIFRSTRVRALGGERFEVSGVLELKGRTQTLTLPATIRSAGGIVTADGIVPISRGYFGIGTADWKDTVADRVTIHFHLVAPVASGAPASGLPARPKNP